MTTPTTVPVRLKLRQDTAANWTSVNPTLLAGELGRESDTGKIKIGNGSAPWTALAYQAWATLPVAVSAGGTGQTTYTNGQLLIGNTTGNTLTKATLTAGSGVAITNGTGSITVAASNIANAQISATAEIAVSKLADGAARQLLQTAANGTDVEWASNIDIPGTLDVTGAATFDGAVTIEGDLTVNGTETIINTQTLTVEDKNIELGKIDTPTDATADGGGITLKGTTDKTINWVDATDAWTFSEHVNIASAKEYRIAGTKVLDATSLGSAVVTSSLTSVGTIGTGVWQGTAIDKTYLDATLVSTGDTGTVTSTMIADGTIVDADINASAAIVDTKLATIATAGKVSNSATTATSANTAIAIVARDASGNFAAGKVSLTGDIEFSRTNPAAITVGTAGNITLSADSNNTIAGSQINFNVDGLEAADITGTGTLRFNTADFAGAGVCSQSTSGFLRLGGGGNAQNSGINVTLSGPDDPGTNAGVFVRDSTTNIYRWNRASDFHAWSTGGSERLRITSAGLVGIGTSAPSSLLHLADAGNITVGTTTGTKIGTATTQKLGFYNATPVVQPAAVADATDAASVITQLNDLLAKLRTLGIIAT
jgi:hypothetical protein